MFDKIFDNSEKTLSPESRVIFFAFKKDLLNANELKTEGFEQHAEILCKEIRKGKKFYEVPISYNGRTHEDGKKIKFYHIFEVLYRIVFGKFK